MYKLKTENYPKWVKITQKEWKKLRPNEVPRSFNVLLPKRSGVSDELENDLAIFLNNKYSRDVFIINDKGENVTIKDGLDELDSDGTRKGTDINTLRTMAKELGVNAWGLKKEEIKILIREARKDNDN